MKTLVLGVTGMLGNSMFRLLSNNPNFNVYGTIRNSNAHPNFSKYLTTKLITGVDVENNDSLIKVLAQVKPTIVINCIGLIKQLPFVNDPLQLISINSLLPHRIAALCKLIEARLIHISTDCVFSGKKGNYLESDFPDAYDLYGRSKLLGEVDYPHTITLRTSIIGHELSGQKNLINWFLAQTSSIKGFTQAIFSGFPTVELAKIIRDFVIPHPQLRGLYHVAAKPINKFDLLTLVANVYKKNIKIISSNDLVINRSLNAQRFNEATGYAPPKWQKLIYRMHEFK